MRVLTKQPEQPINIEDNPAVAVLNAGISDWQEALIEQTIHSSTQRISVTNGLTKVPEEQSKWDIWINQPTLEQSRLNLPKTLVQKIKKVQSV